MECLAEGMAEGGYCRICHPLWFSSLHTDTTIHDLSMPSPTLFEWLSYSNSLPFPLKGGCLFLSLLSTYLHYYSFMHPPTIYYLCISQTLSSSPSLLSLFLSLSLSFSQTSHIPGPILFLIRINLVVKIYLTSNHTQTEQPLRFFMSLVKLSTLSWGPSLFFQPKFKRKI